MTKRAVESGDLFDIGAFLDGATDLIVVIPGKNGRPDYRLPVSFNPDAVTARLTRRYRELMDAERGDEAVVEFLESVLVSWRIKDKATGEQLGVGREQIESVNLYITEHVAKAITEVMFPAADESGKAG